MMKTCHAIYFSDSRQMDRIDSGTVDLVVTSPPYPMIEMWDGLFSEFSKKIQTALKKQQGPRAFELMHRELDPVWEELYRVVKPSGFVCINIGDATRKIGDEFQLYSNHTRITGRMVELGFSPLPVILWKKPTNLPNKFMGSGMLPAGAYVTLEHEYILIFRKGGKRVFKPGEQKQDRNESAIFWEERNNWYSDTWRMIGARQKTGRKNIRDRNGAFPFELAHRLINMYSVKNDTVLDPFLGTGTSTSAAIVTQRHSVGIEYDKNFAGLIKETLADCPGICARTVNERLENHRQFIKSRIAEGKPVKHHNEFYDFPVITLQERQIRLNTIKKIISEDLSRVEAHYISNPGKSEPIAVPPETKADKDGQLTLF